MVPGVFYKILEWLLGLGITLFQCLRLFLTLGGARTHALLVESNIFKCNEWTTPSKSIECASANPFPEEFDLILVQLISIEQPVVPRTLLLR